ncbi:MAG TPA: Holliday junction resolvase RuvX [Gemmatimonadota bacterium]|nr:Holliday junction resolvase RuvX [Gemmatimonadota bacterium]
MTGERVLAVDIGERRVGLALAEPGRALVEGLPTVDRKTLKGTLVDEIRRIAAERAVDRIVLGIPLSMDGSEGPAARLAREFEAELAAALEVPVEEWDERLSTEAARTRLRQIGYSEREMRSRLDQLSAVLMLEGWLRARTLADERETGDRG